MYEFDIVGECWFCHLSPPCEVWLLLQVATFTDYVNYLLCTPLIYIDFNSQIFNTASDWIILLCFVLISTFLIGIYPASRLVAFQTADTLKQKGVIRQGHSLFGKGMIVFQFSLSIFCVVATIFGYRQIDYMRNKDLGFKPERIVILPIFQADRSLRKNHEIVKEALLQYSGISKATASLFPPGHENSIDMITVRLVEQPEIEQIVHFLPVDKDFIETYNLELLVGNTFSRSSFGNEVILNETAVKQLGWLDRKWAIGKELVSKGNRWVVVGVVKDFHNRSLHAPIRPLLLSSGSNFNYISLKLKPSNIHLTMDFIESQWKRLVPDKPFEFFFLDRYYFDTFYRLEEAMFKAFWIASFLAIAIACLGLFGLASLIADQRKKEICIRKVMGASDWEIAILFTSGFIKMILISEIIIAPITFYVMELWLQNFAYRITLDFTPFLIGYVLILAISIITLSFHIFRMTQINPIQFLRLE